VLAGGVDNRVVENTHSNTVEIVNKRFL